MKTILVLKGGGAKGILQASCMAELYKLGVDVSKADLKVGTSVGSINASALALNRDPLFLMESYKPLLKKVFTKPWYPTIPKYKRSNFISSWKDIFGTTDTLMHEAKNKLIITSVDRCADKPHFFKSWEDKDGKENLVDTICKSFAAPYYFGQINDQKNQKVWIDGGCGIDNLPLEYAYIEAVLQGWLSYPTKIICIGTGYSNKITPYNKASRQGVFYQLKDYLNLPNGGMARVMSSWAQVDRIIKLCEKHTKLEFIYYDIRIPEAADTMDNLKYTDDYIKWGKTMAQAPMIVSL